MFTTELTKQRNQAIKTNTTIFELQDNGLYFHMCHHQGYSEINENKFHFRILKTKSM